MKKLFYLLAFLALPVLGLAQTSILRAPYYDAISNTDSTHVHNFYFANPTAIEDLSLFGRIKVASGGDTVLVIKVRLIMDKQDPISGTVAYDTTAGRDITTSVASGDNWDSTPTTGADYSFKLSSKYWWKPCIGIEVTIKNYYELGGTWNKQYSMQVLPTYR